LLFIHKTLSSKIIIPAYASLNHRKIAVRRKVMLLIGNMPQQAHTLRHPASTHHRFEQDLGAAMASQVVGP
jgi:hypothetical protein